MNTSITSKKGFQYSSRIESPSSLKGIAIKNISSTMKTNKLDLYEEAIKNAKEKPILPNKTLNESCKARDILSDKENILFIQNICSLISNKIQEMDKINLHKLNHSINYGSEDIKFPRYRSKEEDKKNNIVEEFNFLSANFKDDLIIHALTKLWFAVKLLNTHFNPSSEEKIKIIYDECIALFGKSHTFNKEYSFIKNNTLGDDEISSDLLRNLDKLYKLSTRYQPIEYLTQEKPLLDQSKKYLAGTSGMCNCFYNIYPLLDIDFTSSEGQKLAEIMSAFVVAIGFHTFEECYSAFNLTHYHLVALNDENSQTNRRIRNVAFINNKIAEATQKREGLLSLERFKISKNIIDYAQLPDKYKENRDICLSVVKSDEAAYGILPTHLQNELEFATAAVDANYDVFRRLPYDLKSNIDIAKLAVQGKEANYQHLPNALKVNPGFALAVIEVNPRAYQYLPQNLRSNIDVAKLALKEGSNYKYLPHDLQTELEFALIAIESDPSTYKYLLNNLQSNIDVAKLAVQGKGLNYYYLPKLLKENPELALKAVEQDDTIYHFYLPENLKLNTDIAMAFIRQRGSNYRYLPNPLKEKPEFAFAAIQQDPNMYEELTTEMKLICDAQTVTHNNNKVSSVSKLSVPKPSYAPQSSKTREFTKIYLTK